MINIEEIYKYLSPFIAAFIASYLTYFFTMRTKKHDIILKERISAFKAIAKHLVSIKRYCLAKIADYEGLEFSPRVEDLPEEDRKSVLKHKTELYYLVEENIIFLSNHSRKSLVSLDGHLGILCNVELELAGRDPHPFIQSSAKEAWKALLSATEVCIDNLYSELKLPK